MGVVAPGGRFDMLTLLEVVAETFPKTALVVFVLENPRKSKKNTIKSKTIFQLTCLSFCPDDRNVK